MTDYKKTLNLPDTPFFTAEDAEEIRKILMRNQTKLIRLWLVTIKKAYLCVLGVLRGKRFYG